MLVLALPSQAAQPLRIDYPDFWPFFTRVKGHEMTGFFYEIVNEALNRIGIESTWHEFPWGRCQDNVQSSEADAMITVPTQERLAYTTTHPTPFYTKRLTIFTYSKHPRLEEIHNIKSIDDIVEGGFSVITYVGNGWHDKNISSRGIHTYESPHLNKIWLMLARQRGDIVIEWPGAAWPAIEKAGVANEVIQTTVTLEAMPFHLLIRKTCPCAKKLPEFDAAIRQMHADGTINKIMEKYN